MKKWEQIISFSALLFLSSIGVVIGVTAKEFYDSPISFCFLLLIAAIFLLFFFFVRQTSWRSIFPLIILLFLLAIRIRQQRVEFTSAEKYAGETHTFAGYVISYGTTTSRGCAFRMKVKYKREENVFLPIRPFELLVNVKGLNAGDIFRWDTCTLETKLKIPDSQLRIRRGEGGFHYRKYLYSKKCVAVAQVKTKEITFLQKKVDARQFLLPIGRLRNRVTERIKSLFQSRYSGFLLAIFFGDRSLLEDEMEEQFRSTGMIHLLAISGFHIGVIGTILFWFFSLWLSEERALKLSVCFLLLFLFLLNDSPSAARAFIMYAFACGYRNFGGTCGRLHSLSLSGVLIVMLNPYSIYDLGFILSFMATGGIFLFSGEIERYLPRKIPQRIRSSFSITASAFFSVCLIQAALFHQLPFFSLFSSLLILPLFSILFLFLFVALPLICLLPCSFLIVLTEGGLSVFFLLISWLDRIKPLKIDGITESVAYSSFILLFFFVYLIFPFLRSRWKKKRWKNLVFGKQKVGMTRLRTRM